MKNAKVKKILSMSLVVVVAVISAIVGVAVKNLKKGAGDNRWDGVTVVKPSGDGCADDPFIIESAENLAWVARELEFDQAYTFNVVKDIDLNCRDWTPIGSESNPFLGSFYGNGYTIKNIGSNEKGFYSSSDKQAPSLFGVAGADSLIQGVMVDYAFSEAVDTTNWGGIVSVAKTGVSVSMCANVTPSVTFSGIVANVNYGGLVGVGYKNTTIINSYSLTSLAISGVRGMVGGLVGKYCYSGNTIVNSYTSGKIDKTKSSNSWAGSIVGFDASTDVGQEKYDLDNVVSVYSIDGDAQVETNDWTNFLKSSVWSFDLDDNNGMPTLKKIDADTLGSDVSCGGENCEYGHLFEGNNHYECGHLNYEFGWFDPVWTGEGEACSHGYYDSYSVTREYIYWAVSGIFYNYDENWNCTGSSEGEYTGDSSTKHGSVSVSGVSAGESYEFVVDEPVSFGHLYYRDYETAPGPCDVCGESGGGDSGGDEDTDPTITITYTCVPEVGGSDWFGYEADVDGSWDVYVVPNYSDYAEVTDFNEETSVDEMGRCYVDGLKVGTAYVDCDFYLPGKSSWCVYERVEIIVWGKLSTVPSQSGTLTYNGSSQSPTWSGYDSEKMIISGTTSAVEAGTYTAYFTPKSGYGWTYSSDRERKAVTWTIEKGKPYIVGMYANTGGYTAMNFAANAYLTTDFTMDYSKSFNATSSFMIPSTGKRYLLLGSYSGSALQVEINANNFIRLYVEKATNMDNVGDVALSANTWYYYSIDYNNSTGVVTLNVYFDGGSLVDTVTATVSTRSGTATNAFRIGTADYRGNTTTFSAINIGMLTFVQDSSVVRKIVPTTATSWTDEINNKTYTVTGTGALVTSATVSSTYVTYASSYGTLQTPTKTGYTFKGHKASLIPEPSTVYAHPSTSTWTSGWSTGIKLQNLGVTLTTGKTYKFAFDIKLNSTNDITQSWVASTLFVNNQTSGTIYHLTNGTKASKNPITTSWQRFYTTFVYTADTGTYANDPIHIYPDFTDTSLPTIMTNLELIEVVDSGYVASTDTMTRTSNQMLYAQWEINTYTLTDTNGYWIANPSSTVKVTATAADSSTVTLVSGSTTSTSGSITVSKGATFYVKHTYSTSAITITMTRVDTSVDHEIWLYDGAHSATNTMSYTWTPNANTSWTYYIRAWYTISASAGTGTTASVYGHELTPQNNRNSTTRACYGWEVTWTGSAKTGYTWQGWYTASNGGGTKLTSSTTYTISLTGHTTYYAYATATPYTITLDPNSGTLSDSSWTASSGKYTKTYYVTSSSITLPTPTRTGYTFAGWTGSNGTTVQTSVTVASGSTGNKSYTANWTIADSDKTAITSSAIQTVAIKGYAQFNVATITASKGGGKWTYSLVDAGANFALTSTSATTGSVTLYFKTGASVGTYSAKVKATSSYNATSATTAAITVTINSNDMTVSVVAYSGTYDGSAHSATIKVTYPSATTIKWGTASGTYSNTATSSSATSTSYNIGSRTAAGTSTIYYQITKSGYNTYSGSTTITIAQKSISGATIGSVSNYTYDGTAKTPTPSVTVGGKTLTKDTDYTISYSNNTNVGTATITFTGKGNYTGTATKTFTITAQTSATVSVTATNKVYNAASQTTTLTVKVGSTAFTTSQYTVTGNTGTNAGTYTAKVTISTGNYAGSSGSANWTIYYPKLTVKGSTGTTVTSDQVAYPKYNTKNMYTTNTGSTTKTLTIPSKTGYTFNGWYTATSGGTQMLTAGGALVSNWTSTSDTIVYPQFTINSYTVKVNPNGGYRTSDNSTAVISFSKNYGETEPISERKRTGYTLTGYTLTNTSSGSTSDVGGATFTFDSSTKTGSYVQGTVACTLTANWTPNKYKVTLDNQSATSAGTTAVWYYYNTTASIGGETVYYYTDEACSTKLASYTITKPTRTGYTFGGYYTATGGSGTQYVNANGAFVNNLYASAANNTTLYANWTINKYTLTVNPNGGSYGGSSSNTSVSQNFDTSYTPSYPSRTGYSFMGWTHSGSGSFSDGHSSSGFTATAKTEGGISYTNYTSDYTGTGSSKWFNTSFPYYTFTAGKTYVMTICLRVNSVPSGSYLYFRFSRMSNDWQAVNTGYSASTNGWVVIQMEQTLEATSVRSGTSYTTQPMFEVYTSDCKTSGSSFKFNYDIAYCNVSQKDTGTQVFNSCSYKFGAGAGTLTANWSVNTYSISYNLNGGSVATANPTTYNVNTASFTLNNPTKTGYTFAGWTGSNGTTAQTSVTIAKGSTGNKTYTANWTINKYTLTINPNGGTYKGTASNTTVSQNYATTYVVLDTTTSWTGAPLKVTRAGYTFTGWELSGAGSYNASNYTYTFGAGACTLKAQWSASTYNISFDLAGGTGLSNTTYTSASAKSITTIPTRTGYTFAGWTETITNMDWQRGTINLSTGAFEHYNDYPQAIYSSPISLVSGVTYTLTCDPTDIRMRIWNSSSQYQGSVMTKTITGSSSYGIVRVWYYSGSGTSNSSTDIAIRNNTVFATTSGTLPSINIIAGSTGNRTYKANWTVNSYAVTVNANGGTIPATTGWTVASGSGTASKNIVYGGTYGTLPTPTRSGYTFAGWYTAQTGGTKVESTTNMSTASQHTLYAHWTINSYALTVNGNGGTFYTNLISSIENEGSSTSKIASGTMNYYVLDGVLYAESDTSSTNDHYGMTNIAANLVSGKTYIFKFKLQSTNSSVEPNADIGWFLNKGYTTYQHKGTFAAKYSTANTYSVEISAAASGVFYLRVDPNVTNAKIKFYDMEMYEKGSSTVSTASYTQNYNTVKALPTPTRTGYTFAGWSKTSGAGTLTSNAFRYGAGTATVTAQWKEIATTISTSATTASKVYGYSEFTVASITASGGGGKWTYSLVDADGHFKLSSTTATTGSVSLAFSAGAGVGTYTAKVKAVSAYNSTTATTGTITVTITAYNMSSCTITLGYTSAIYTGSALQPSVTVKNGTTTLTLNTHYTVAYSGNTNVGTATVTVTGKGNYTGTKTATFTISKLKVQVVEKSGYTKVAKVYDGTTSVSTTLANGTHYTVQGITTVNGSYTTLSNADTYITKTGAVYNSANAGDRTITVSFALASNMTSSNVELVSSTVSLTSASITRKATAVTWSGATATYTYNGNNQGSSITATYSGINSTTLSATISYSGKATTFKDAGSYTVTATVGSNYQISSGVYSESKSVVMNKANISPVVSMSNYTYGGSIATPSVTGNSGNGTVTYYYNTTNSNSGGTVWSNMTSTTLSVGTYYIYATVATTSNYNGATTSAKEFKVTVNTLSTPTSLSWSKSVASWGAVANASSYTVVLYNGSTAVQTLSVTTTSVDMASYFNATSSSWKFTVQAIASGNYASSSVSSASATTSVYSLSVAKGTGITSVSPTSTQYGVQGRSITISATVTSGYTWSSWSISGTTPTMTATTKDQSVTLGAGNTTLTATANANKYKVTLDNQSATTAGTTAVWYYYNTTKTVNGVTAYYYSNEACTTPLASGHTITKPTRTGYTFGGYYTSTGGSGTQYVNADGMFVNNVYKSKTESITLYAKWTVVTYSISYTLNGGSVATANPTTYNVNTASFTLNNPTKAGYTFAGWTGSNGTTAQTSVTIAKGSTGNKSYTANWSIDKLAESSSSGYTGTYDGNSHNIKFVASHASGKTISYAWYKGSVATANLISGATSSTYAVKNVADSGTYVCRASLTDGSSNIYLDKSLTVSITAATPTISMASYTAVYSGNNIAYPTSNVTVAGVKTGDTPTGSITYTYQPAGGSYSSTTPKNAGSYTVKATIAASGNYASTSKTQTMTITKSVVSVTAVGNFSPTASTKSYIETDYDGQVAVSKSKAVLGTHYTITATGLVPSIGNQLSMGDFAGELTANVQYSGSTIKGVTGTARITLVDSTNFAFNGTDNTYLDLSLNIKKMPLNLSSASIAGVSASYIYTGNAITPTVSVTRSVGGTTTTLVKDTDYTVSYSSNTSVGTATVTVTGKGNFTGTKTTTYSITESDIKNASVSSIADQTYTGSAIAPTISVSMNSKTLVKDTDYTLTYKDNTNAGTASIVITGKGNYTGTKTVSFNIKPKSVSVPTSPQDKTYNGVSQACGIATPSNATVQTGSTTSATNVGTYTVTYALNNTTNYVWSDGTTTNKSVSWKIVAFNISSATVEAIPDQTYTGSDIKKTTNVSVILNGSTHVLTADEIAYTYSGDTINVGTVTVTISGKGNFTGSQKTTYKIVNQTATGSVVISGSVTYGGSVTASIANGISGVAYSYKWQYSTSANGTWTDCANGTTSTLEITAKNVGTDVVSGKVLRVVANATGNYTGSLTSNATNTITAKAVTWSANPSVANKIYDGNATGTITSNGSISGVITGDTVTLSSANAKATFNTSDVGAQKTVTFSGYALSGANAQNYTIAQPTGVKADITKLQVTVVAKSGYSTNATTKTYVVKTYDGTNSVTTTLVRDTHFTVSSSLASVTYSAVYATADAKESNNITVTFTLNDTINMEFGDAGNTITINGKINKVSKEVVWETSASYTYNGNAQTVKAYYTNLSNTKVYMTVVYTGKSSTFKDAGEYTATASGTDTNYAYTNTTKSLTINTKEVNISWTGDSYIYNGKEQGPTYTTSGVITGDSVTFTAENDKKTNVGTYTASVTIGGSRADNYHLKNESHAWKIESMTLAKPSIDGEYRYTGNEQTVSLTNYDESKFALTNNKQTNAGSYTVKVALKDKVNYKWQDNTTTDVSLTWTIAKANNSTIKLSEGSIDIKVGESYTVEATVTYVGTHSATTVSTSGLDGYASVSTGALSNKTCDVAITGLKGVSNGTLTITLPGDSNHESVSIDMTVNITALKVAMYVTNKNGTEATVKHGSISYDTYTTEGVSEFNVGYGANVSLNVKSNSGYGWFYYDVNGVKTYNTNGIGIDGIISLKDIKENKTVKVYFAPLITINFKLTGETGNPLSDKTVLKATRDGESSVAMSYRYEETSGTYFATALVFGDEDIVVGLGGVANIEVKSADVIKQVIFGETQILTASTLSVDTAYAVTGLGEISAGGTYIVTYETAKALKVDNAIENAVVTVSAESSATITSGEDKYILKDTEVEITVGNIGSDYAFVGFKNESGDIYYWNSKETIEYKANDTGSYRYGAKYTEEVASLIPMVTKKSNAEIKTVVEGATAKLTHKESKLEYSLTTGTMSNSVMGAILTGEYILETDGTVEIKVNGTTVPATDGVYTLTIDENTTTVEITVRKEIMQSV